MDVWIEQKGLSIYLSPCPRDYTTTGKREDTSPPVRIIVGLLNPWSNDHVFFPSIYDNYISDLTSDPQPSLLYLRLTDR